MEKISVAFLGVRHPHMWHRVELLKNNPEARVLGFYDGDSYYAENFESRTGFYRAHSPEELLSQKPDLCIIEAMDDQTPSYARMAAPSVKAMILEKCTAQTFEENRKLREDLKDYPVHVEHGFELHYLQIVDKCREIIHSGVLGQITLARFHGGSPIGCSTEIWVEDPGLMGGMVYIEGSHMIELMLDTLGEPDTVEGCAVKLEPGQSMVSDITTSDLFRGPGVPPKKVQIGTMMYEDVGVGIARYPDKVAVLDFTAWESTGWCNGWRMEYYGTNGTLIACPIPSWAVLQVRAGTAGYERGEYRFEYPSVTEEGNTLMRDTYKRQLGKVFGLIREGSRDSGPGMTMICNVSRVAECIYASDERGKKFKYK